MQSKKSGGGMDDNQRQKRRLRIKKSSEDEIYTSIIKSEAAYQQGCEDAERATDALILRMTRQLEDMGRRISDLRMKLSISEEHNLALQAEVDLLRKRGITVVPKGMSPKGMSPNSPTTSRNGITIGEERQQSMQRFAERLRNNQAGFEPELIVGE
jgi:hypothetical protein